MDNTYFESIERHCQITKKNNYTSIKPTRKINRNMFQGEVIEQTGVSQLPDYTIKEMVDGANLKYTKMTEQIIRQIQTTKRKGKVKYQTLGWKQAKEIKSWCDENNINTDLFYLQPISSFLNKKSGYLVSLGDLVKQGLNFDLNCDQSGF